MNRLMSSLIFSLVAFLSPAQAQQASVESVETMLRITKVEALTESMFTGMDDVMKQVMS